jgi:hypothetical protein
VVTKPTALWTPGPLFYLAGNVVQVGGIPAIRPMEHCDDTGPGKASVSFLACWWERSIRSRSTKIRSVRNCTPFQVQSAFWKNLLLVRRHSWHGLEEKTRMLSGNKGHHRVSGGICAYRNSWTRSCVRGASSF